MFGLQAIEVTDHRVHVIHEILLAIKLIKFYAWERTFSKSVYETRQKELKWLETILTSDEKRYPFKINFLYFYQTG